MGLFNRKPRPETRLRALSAASPSTTRSVGRVDKIASKTKGWQEEAWEYYDSVGELRYTIQYLHNALSRARLIASDVDETGNPTGACSDPTVQEIVRDIAGGPAGQAALLGAMATHLSVPGECYVAILAREIDGVVEEEWYVLSTSEVRKERTGAVTVTLPDGTDWDLDPAVDSIHRVWVPHARVANQADSVVRAALPTLREMTRLGQWVEATAKSRVVSNGILAVPNEIRTPEYTPPGGSSAYRDAPGLAPVDGEDDPFAYPVEKSGPEALTDALLETMATAIQNPSSAAALVPIIVEAPGEWIDKIQHINLSSEFTDTVMKLRDAATRRLALSLNVPAEVLTGVAAANHWSAWQIDESATKLHIEPLLTVICDRLTDYVLRPLLDEAGIDPGSFTIWYDTSALTLKPDRSSDAREAHALGVISDETLRRELGFDDSDAPETDLSEADLRSLAVQIVKSAPSTLPLLAEIIGFDLPDVVPVSVPGVPGASVGSPAPNPPADGPPARDDSEE